jgi:hypothetical protein
MSNLDCLAIAARRAWRRATVSYRQRRWLRNVHIGKPEFVGTPIYVGRLKFDNVAASIISAEDQETTNPGRSHLAQRYREAIGNSVALATDRSRHAAMEAAS